MKRRRPTYGPTVPLGQAVLWLLIVAMVGTVIVVVFTTGAAGDEPPPVDCTSIGNQLHPFDANDPGPCEHDPRWRQGDPEACTPETCPPGCVDPSDEIPCVWERDDHPAEPTPAEPGYTG